MKLIDLTGQKIDGTRLTVVGRAPNRGKRVAWLCLCECGNEVVVTSTHLRSGHTKSCGCYNDEKRSATHKKHGMKDTDVYNEWNAMKQRCGNPNVSAYARYGGRGIRVCDRWANDFQLFYEDVSVLPHFGEEGYSLNRINNDGDYEPENVEWADKETQANNKQNNRFILHEGEIKTVAQWVRCKNITVSAFYHRIERGWDVERALNTPLKKRK